MVSQSVKHTLIDKYRSLGPERFYQFLLAYGTEKFSKMDKGQSEGPSPEVELLEYYDQILSLYRKGAEAEHLELAAIFRRAAHKLYRDGVKQKLIKKNIKFLQAA